MKLEFEINNNNLILTYMPDYGIENIISKLENNECVSIKRTFFVERSNLVSFDNILDDEKLNFIIGKKEGNFIKLDSNVFDIKHNIYFSIDSQFEKKIFIVDNISIIKKIDELIEEDLYIGKDGLNNNCISKELFYELINQFPTRYELEKYTNQRISLILKEYLPQIDKHEEVYKKYIDKKNKKKIEYSNADKNISYNVQIEIEQFSIALDELKYMLNHSNAYQETDWQIKIQEIIQILYPKYILSKREMTFSGIDYNEKRPDFILVDANGFIDVMEIKKPEAKILTREASYRNNYVPVRELAGSIQQLEKYIYCLTRLDDKIDPFYITLKSFLPKNVNPIVLNPQGILILGRNNSFNEQQKRDFELIRRQYKNIAEIITYDDLIQRFENIIEALKMK